MSHVGNDIRRARENKKLSVEDVAKMTKISPAVINDIENGKFSLYTGDEPYVRMYIKKLSQVLDLDGYELTQQYNNLSMEIQKEIEDAKNEVTPTVARQMNFEKPNYARKPSVYEDRSHITLIRGVILLSLICLVVGIVWYAIVSTRNDPSQFEEPGSTHVEGNVELNDRDENDKEEEIKVEKPSAVIEKVADYDYKFKVTSEDTFILRMEFKNKTWSAIYLDYVNGTALKGFDARIYGPKTKTEIDNGAAALLKHNEENPHCQIEQKEDMEIVELTFNVAEFKELYLRTGYSKGHRYYINGVELILSENETIEGVSNLHIVLDKEN